MMRTKPKTHVGKRPNAPVRSNKKSRARRSLYIFVQCKSHAKVVGNLTYDMHFVVCRLPAGEDTSKIQAKFDNGVLEVVVPKTKAATQHETKQIQL
jgi:hypothetical protein